MAIFDPDERLPSSATLMLCNLFLQNCANHLTEHDCNSEEEVGVHHQLHLKPLFIIIYENKFTIMYKQQNIVYSNATLQMIKMNDQQIKSILTNLSSGKYNLTILTNTILNSDKFPPTR